MSDSFYDINPLKDLYSKPDKDGYVTLPHFIPENQRHHITELLNDSKVKYGTRKHGHPVMHLERILLENKCVHYLRNRYKIEKQFIHDVGGASGRHYIHGRSDVWSSQPIVCAQDHFRQTALSISCRHMGQLCDCREFFACMFVHSVYYLTPEAVAIVLTNTTTKTGLVLLHMFEGDQGGYNGESTWIKDAGTISMKVNGNVHSYVHSDVEWLRATHAVTRCGTLVWTNVFKSETTVVLEIKLVPETVIQDTRFSHGEVHVTCTAKQLRGIWPLQWSEKYQASENVPADVFTKLKLFMVGQKADAVTYRTLCHKGNTLLREKSITDPRLASRMLNVMVHNLIAMDDKLEQDLLRAQQDMWEQRELRTELLGLPPAAPTSWKATVGYACLTGFALIRTPNLLMNAYLPISAMVLVSVPVLTMVRTYLNTKPRRPTPAPPLSPLLVTQLSPLPIPEGNSIKFDLVDSKPPTGELAPYGITIKNSRPVAYASVLENEIVSVSNRALQTDFKIDDKAVAQLTTFVFAHFDVIFPERQDVVPVFEDWNRRYPAKKQEDHVKAQSSGKTSGKSIRKSFVKVEKLNYVVNNKVTDKAPRLIQGASDSYNIALGPWIYAFSKELARIWNANHFIFYTAGSTGEEIGAWLPCTKNYYENDYSKYDASIHQGLLKLELKIYRRFGMRKELSKLMTDNLDKCGFTPNNVKYSVKGTRPSGDQNTSCGNSLLNGIIMAWAFYKATGNFDFKSVVMGDDNLLATNMDVDIDKIEKQILGLGLNPKLQLKTNVNLLEYCSMRFWPTDSGRVLGPKIGKFAVKVGWMLRPPKGDERRKREYRGTLLSHLTTVTHVPVLRMLVTRMLNIIGRERYIKDNERRMQNAEQHEANDTTWNMVADLYNLTKEDVLDIERDIAKAEMGEEISHHSLDVMIEHDC